MIAAKHSMAGGANPYDAEVEWVDTNGGYIITPATLKNVDDVTVRFDGSLIAWSGTQVIGSFRNDNEISNDETTGFRLIANRDSRHYFLDNGYKRIYTRYFSWQLNKNIKLEMNNSNNSFCVLDGVSLELVRQQLGGYITEGTPISICACLDGTGERARVKVRNIEILQEGIPILSLMAVRKEEEGFLYDTISKTLLATVDGERMLYGTDL